MATKIIRFVSQQSGPFNATTNNKVDVSIPSYVSYIDPTQSCITLNLKLLNGTTDLGLFDAGFNDGLDARSLLKNITISSDKNGVIEQIPAANILYANIDQTQRDFEDENAKAVYGFGTTADNLGTGNLATFIRKVNNGDALSTQETYLKIPLSSIFGVCKMQQFPVNLFGNVKITLEFEDDTTKIVPYLFKQVICNPVTIPDSTANQTATINVVEVPRAQSFPLYVGMPIQLKINNANDAVTDRSITSLSYIAARDTIAVTYDKAAATFVTGQTNEILARGSGVGDKDLTYQIRDVEIEVYQYNLAPAQQSKLNANMRKGLSLGFNTWSLERVNMPAVDANNQYTRQFDLEPGTVNVFAMMPKLFDAARGTANSQPLFSLNDGFTDYRWRLNTIDTTSRDITPYQSLYYDRLMTTLSNSYMKIKNLRLTGGKAPSDATTSPQADAAVKTYLIPSPIPRSDESQVLQLRMLRATAAANAGSTILHLYKQVQKDLKIQAGGITVM